MCGEVILQVPTICIHKLEMPLYNKRVIRDNITLRIEIIRH